LRAAIPLDPFLSQFAVTLALFPGVVRVGNTSGCNVN